MIPRRGPTTVRDHGRTRAGVPQIVGLSPAEKILRYSIPEPNTGCWLWLGCHSTQTGYGYVRISKRIVPSHRASYEAFRGPIPEGLVLDHLCRVPACVNPDHLEPVTTQENVRRGLCGVLHPNHCPRGHAYTPDNLVPSARGRQCLICHRRLCRDYARRKKAERAAAEVSP